MDGYNGLNSNYNIEYQKYNTLIQMDCCCFFEYDFQADKLSFSNNMVFPELSGKVIEHCNFQISSIIANEDVQTFLDFLHFGKEFPIEFQIKGYVQNRIWCQANGKKIFDEQNNPVLFVGYVENIEARKKNEAEKNEKLRRDRLTGMLNQTAIKEKISFILRESDLADTYVFLILKICQLEKLNQYFGDIFGDVVLTNIASKLKTVVLSENLIGRIGADKFLIFFKNMENNDLNRSINQINEIIRNTYTGENRALNLYCEAGYSKFPKDGKSYNELFRKADIALFFTRKAEEDRWLSYEQGKMKAPVLLNGKLFYNSYDTGDVSSYGFGDMDMELVGFTLDLLGKTKDVGSAINILLDKMGRTFCVNDVFVVEKETGCDSVSANYSWNFQEGIGKKRFSQNYIERLMQVLEAGQSERDIQCIRCKKDLQIVFEEWAELEEKNVENILLCGYYDNEALKGYVYMDACGNKRIWQKQEVDSFVFIAKIVAFYLLKLRESERISEKMHMIENYDLLTGLPTLNKFRVDAQIICESHPNLRFAIGYMDINNFKYVNDTLGYEKGDRLLKDLADFLKRESVSLQINARSSADNFVCLIPFDDEKKLKEEITKAIHKFLLEQKTKNVTYNIGIAIGIYVMKNIERDFMSVIDNANTARKLVKNSSLSICEFYDDKIEHEIMKERMILGSMDKALANNEFKVFLQPKISLKNSCIIGAEALVRWIREDGTMLAPNDFIPLFEKNGFIIKLDFCIYEEVCKLFKRWREENRPIVPVSVNVSRVHLYQADFIEKILSLVDKYQIEPWMLEFELTESIFLDNTVTAITIMKELRNHGFCVSIDDFGAGYSSLNLLKDMRTDVLKLDKEFFRAGDMKKEEQIIVSSIISMAKQLNMKVLSEGVETQKQSEFLKKVNCDMAQGYLYARPLPVEEFEKMLCKCT